MYEAMDLLHENIDAVEKAILLSAAGLLNREADLIFYDTTTASFCTGYEDEDSGRMFGRSKEGTWTPQMVVALAVTRDGLPVRSWVLPGNTSDAATVKKVRDDKCSEFPQETLNILKKLKINIPEQLLSVDRHS